MGGIENGNNIGKRIISFKEKLEWDYQGNNVYQYKFNFPLNPERQKGTARVIYRTLGYLNNIEGNTELSRVLTEKGIKQTDIIAHIKEFFPNGRGFELGVDIKEYMRQGFGTEILNFLFEESKANDAKAVYVFTTKEKMINFVHKNGFESVNEKDPRNSRFFRILEQKH